ncbi:MAG: hypothetical protein JOZ54_05045 [Acidobacteria bacterium]|nr:hypothetical protein [Acidobacteriota bacterium]
MRIIPRRYRFALASVASIALRPLVRRSSTFQLQRDSYRMDTEREVALLHALKSMTNAGTRFDAPLTVVNADKLAEAIDAGRGVFIATMHMVLNAFVLRHLYNIEIIPYVFANTPISILGTPHVTHMIAPTPGSVMEARRLLREGEIVVAMLDEAGADDSGRIVSFDTPVGPLRIRETLLHLAHRCGAAIFFLSSYQNDEGGITADLQPAGEAPVEEFVAFVRGHARG